ncbi:hypothetical protein V8F33_014011 [Rhypophila sp. PSN 637]
MPSVVTKFAVAAAVGAVAVQAKHNPNTGTVPPLGPSGTFTIPPFSEFPASTVTATVSFISTETQTETQTDTETLSFSGGPTVTATGTVSFIGTETGTQTVTFTDPDRNRDRNPLLPETRTATTFNIFQRDQTETATGVTLPIETTVTSSGSIKPILTFTTSVYDTTSPGTETVITTITGTKTDTGYPIGTETTSPGTGTETWYSTYTETGSATYTGTYGPTANGTATGTSSATGKPSPVTTKPIEAGAGKVGFSLAGVMAAFGLWFL